MNKVPLSKDNLNNLYSSGLSIPDVASKLKCSPHKVVYWMNKYNLKRRTMSEAVYLYSNPDGDPFSIKNPVSMYEKFLFGLGLGIYWGEGEKVSNDMVRVSNSDPNIIKVFRKFLMVNCQVKVSRIHYYIIAFNDSDINQVRQYWAEILGISGEKFGKIVQIAQQGKGTYKRKSQYGVCTIYVSNIKFKKWFMEELHKLNTLPG